MTFSDQRCHVSLAEAYLLFLFQEEEEMILYAKHCEVCYSTDKERLIACQRCHMVNYCSVAHVELDLHAHAKECQTLAFMLLCMSVQRVCSMMMMLLKRNMTMNMTMMMML